MLCEGNSIRTIERITGIHRDTVMRLGVRIGTACAKIQDEKMRGLNCAQIEVDEIWGFVGAKRNNADAGRRLWRCLDVHRTGRGHETDSLFSSLAKRDAYHAKTFIADLAGRLQKRVQVSSDALAAYADAMERGFGTEVDYGQVSKTYSFVNLTQNAAGRYSPAEVVKIEKRRHFRNAGREPHFHVSH